MFGVYAIRIHGPRVVVSVLVERLCCQIRGECAGQRNMKPNFLNFTVPRPFDWPYFFDFCHDVFGLPSLYFKKYDRNLFKVFV